MKDIFNYVPQYKIITSDADLGIINASTAVFSERIINGIDLFHFKKAYLPKIY